MQCLHLKCGICRPARFSEGRSYAGFIFLPLTTIVYAWELSSGMPTAGINLLWLLIAVIIDLGGLGGGAHRQSRR
jgi:hypothetical protein